MTTLPGAAALAADTLGRVERMLLHSLHDLSEAAGFGTDPGGGPIVPPSVREPAEQLYAWAQHTLMEKAAHADAARNAAAQLHGQLGELKTHVAQVAASGGGRAGGGRRQGAEVVL